MALFGRTKAQALATIARNKDRKGRRRASGGAPQPKPPTPLPTPVLIEPFEALSGFTFATNSTQEILTTNVTQGLGKLRIQGNGINATLNATKITTTNVSPLTIGTIAFIAEKTPESSSSVTGFSNILTISGQSSGQIGNQSESTAKSRAGKKWVCANVAEASQAFRDMAAGPLAISPRATQGGSFLADVRYDAMYMRAEGRPTVVLTFDDGYKTIIDTVFPLMRERGFRGNFYVPSASIGLAQRVTIADCDTLYAAGWDMPLDSTPDDSTTNLADPVAALAALNVNRAYNTARGWTRGIDNFCWTGGLWNEETAAAFKSGGYFSGRTTDPQSFHDRFGLLDLDMTIPSQGASTSTQVTTHLTRLAEIKTRGTTQFFHFHDISMSPQSIGWYTDRFTQFLDALKADVDAGLIDVLTISEWQARVAAATLPA